MLLLTLLTISGVTEAKKIYFQNTGNWNKIYAHHWTENGSGTSWPGEQLLGDGKDEKTVINGITYYIIETTDEKIIFNNNSGNQTNDLIATDGSIFKATNTDNNPCGMVCEDGTIETTEYYAIHGPILNFKNNDWMPGGMKKNANGDWVIENIKLKGSTNFGIKKLNNATQKEWIASAESNTTVVKDVAHKTKANGGNFWWGSNSESVNYNITYSPTANTITITQYVAEGPVPEPVISWALKGSCFGNDGTWIQQELKEVNGKWEANNITVTTNDFGVQYLVDGAQEDWYFAKSADDAGIDGNCVKECVNSNGINFTIAEGTYSFSFDPDTHQLTVTGKATGVLPGANPYKSYYVGIQGTFNGNDYTKNETQPNPEGICTWENIALGKSTFEVKVYNGSNDTWYNNADNDLVVDEWTVTRNVSGSKLNVYGTQDGNVYDIYFDCSNNQVKVVLKQGSIVEPEPEAKTLYVIGEFNDWNNDTSLQMVKSETEDNVYTLTSDTAFTGKWKINDGTWDWSFGMGDDFKQGVENDCWFGGQDFLPLVSTTNSNEVTIKFTLVEGSDHNDSGIASKIYFVDAKYEVEAPVTEYGDEVNVTDRGLSVTINSSLQLRYHFYVLDMDTRNDNKDAIRTMAEVGKPDSYATADEQVEGIEKNEDKEAGTTTYTFSKEFMENVAGITDTLSPNQILTASLYTYHPASDEYSDETEVGITSNGTTTGVEDIIVTDSEEVFFFNLQGVRVANPENGIYIRVQGNTTTKVLVK